MHFIDRVTKKSYDIPNSDVLLPMGKPQRPDWRMNCELLVFLVRRERRVFVAGGEYGFDGLAREADQLEVSALAERFNSEPLRDMASRMERKEARTERVSAKKPRWRFW